MSRSELIHGRLKTIKEKLEDALLVAVSKYTDLKSIQYAYNWGQRDFGENKVQDLADKVKKLPEDINWHFIGRLQSNKVGKLLEIPGLTHIHSIDSLKLLKVIFKKSDFFSGDSLKFFLQVNTSGEEEKGGFEKEDDLYEAVDFILENIPPHFNFYGLMTMGKIRTENLKEDALKSFSSLNQYRTQIEERYNLPDLKLSMGMSQDYELALEQGADYVRLGSTIFN